MSEIIVQSLAGEQEVLSDFQSLLRTRKVNGEKTVSLLAFPSKRNIHSMKYLTNECSIFFNEEEYVIKNTDQKSIGHLYSKSADGIAKFYVDLINSQQPLIHNGSMTFENYMAFVFTGTPYNFVIMDFAYAEAYENLGNDNRLALFQKGLERYNREFELIGNTVYLKKKIGNDTDFMFGFGHNINAIDIHCDSTNLATRILGRGASTSPEETPENEKVYITAEYISPKSAVWGVIDSPSLTDERYTSKETLSEAMQEKLMDEPEFSLTIDFQDLRAAGYPYTVPNEGDRVFVIHEGMDNLEIETRIVEINEQFEWVKGELVPVYTNVTLANYQKKFAENMFDAIQKQLSDIVNSDGVIKYSVVDEAIRLATQALQSAQTELEFENGIIARDKTNPNNLVLFNAAGVGVSVSGGQTFEAAITALGVIAERIFGKLLIGEQLYIESDSGVITIKDNKFTVRDASNTEKVVLGEVATGEYGVYVAKGAITIERPDGYAIINNGMSVYDVNIQGSSPTFTSPSVSVENWYFKTNSTTSSDCDFFSYEHKARYLKLRLAYKTQAPGGSATVTIERGTVALGNIEVLATITTTSSTEELYATITVDLGVPTGAVGTFYLRLKTNEVAHAAYARVNRKWLEG
ncbi:phage minor structural protein [Psychrobacillus insolitus]|uniref:Phage minor structural protein n=1 Tax=Psychrobacillus insolitus TaxID=1461 RepID=A0A2W7NBQ6_9BACI|nr:phage tail protein [Psychrobacillus insolitus]PZX07889.1 phage minor structural protein [Psychrobacillus insolitus]